MNDETRLPWFPCEPGKLLNALQAMKPHVGYTYWIVCLRIYETGGPIVDSLDALARRTGYNKRVVSDALDVLFRSGKLVRDGAAIMNPYAAEVLDGMKARHGKAVASGREGANARWQKPQSDQSEEDGNAIAKPEQRYAHLQGHLDLESSSSGTPPTAAARPRRKREAAPRIRMPQDWYPDDAGIAYAAARGFTGPDVEAMIRKCRDRHIRAGTLIAGTNGLAATWRMWCDNEVRFRERDRQKPGDGRGSIYDIAAGHQLGGSR